MDTDARSSGSDELIEVGNQAVGEALGLCVNQPHKLSLGPPISLSHDLEKVADGVYSGAPKSWIVQYIGGELRQEILELKSVRKFRDLLVDLNVPLTQFGQLTGNVYSQSTNDFEMLWFQNILLRSSRGGIDYTYNAEIVLPVVRGVISAIRQCVITAVHFVPLTGCALQAPLDLGEGFLIREMAADEISFALQMSAISSTRMPGDYVMIEDTCRWALTREVDLPAVVGPSAEAAPAPPDLLGRADTFARAAAVAIGGSVVPTHQLLKNRPTALGSTWSGSASPRHVASTDPKRPCRIDPSDHQKIISIYERLRQAPTPQYLLAINRIYDSYLRLNAADQLIDLVIATEAVFVPSGATTEVTFRASLNLSLLLRDSPELGYIPSRAQLFVAKVYGLRSKLVHGDQINERKLPDLMDGSRPEGLDAVVETLRNLLSLVMVELLRVDHSNVPNWQSRLTMLLDS